jgi:hypothetical protein
MPSIEIGYKAPFLGTNLAIHETSTTHFGAAPAPSLRPVTVGALQILRVIDDCRRRNPMTSANPASHVGAILERQWGDATIEVIRAQSEYAGLVSRGVEDHETITAAWLRLWQAQERQRQLSSELDRMVT